MFANENRALSCLTTFRHNFVLAYVVVRLPSRRKFAVSAENVLTDENPPAKFG